MSVILNLGNLNKSYGKHEAIKNLDLKLEENTIYGLLGRNGAGKTTLLNMITGSVFPDSGVIEVAGKRVKGGEMPADTSYVREKNLFFGNAKVIEILQMAAVFHKHWDWDFALELVKKFKLNPNKKISKLSRGMESLVGNIIGLASRAPLTIFDEPVLGLDVLMREKFYRVLLEDYANHPRTIIFSTHLIDEIAKVVEKVTIIEEGSVLLVDEVDNIRTKSYLIRGKREEVEPLINAKRVIYKESYADGMLAALYDTVSDQEKTKAAKQGVQIEGLPLQKFFAYLIEGGEEIE